MGKFLRMAVDIRASEDTTVLSDAHEIRRQVFIEEQGVPESIEMDDKDDESIHLVAYEGKSPVGTARIREIEANVGKVERVAVLPTYRGNGIGERLMHSAEDVLAKRGIERIIVHAQRRVEGFYDALGYERIGGEFDEAGIPHVEMVRWV